MITWTQEAGHSDAVLAMEQEKCLRLRLQGKSIRQIASIVHMPKSTVERRLRCAIAERIDPLADQLRAVEVARLDQLLETVWATVKADTEAAVKLAAVDRLVKISERRSKLLGLDAPVSADVRVTTQEDADAALDALIAGAAADLLAERAAEGQAAIEGGAA